MATHGFHPVITPEPEGIPKKKCHTVLSRGKRRKYGMKRSESPPEEVIGDLCESGGFVPKNS